MSAPSGKRYLGDGVYVDFDGYHFVLTAENGIEASDTIYMEPAVFHALTAYVVETLVEPIKEQTSGRDEDRDPSGRDDQDGNDANQPGEPSER